MHFLHRGLVARPEACGSDTDPLPLRSDSRKTASGAGPGLHHTQTRVPRPSRVLCERAGLLEASLFRCHPEEAQAVAKRRSADEEPAPSLPRGSLHFYGGPRPGILAVQRWDSVSRIRQATI
jgi:hypothetical protein